MQGQEAANEGAPTVANSHTGKLKSFGCSAVAVPFETEEALLVAASQLSAVPSQSMPPIDTPLRILSHNAGRKHEEWCLALLKAAGVEYTTTSHFNAKHAAGHAEVQALAMESGRHVLLMVARPMCKGCEIHVSGVAASKSMSLVVLDGIDRPDNRHGNQCRLRVMGDGDAPTRTLPFAVPVAMADGVWIAERAEKQRQREQEQAEKQLKMEQGIVALKTAWLMTKDDLVTFMSDGVASAIAGDSAQAFWDGLVTLRTTWHMTKDDLVKFMCGSVASAIAGDSAQAQAFWCGLEELRPFFTSVELRQFVCGGIASRLKTGQVSDIVAVIDRVGAKKAKSLLTKQPLLVVLSEFVAFMHHATPAELAHAIDANTAKEAKVKRKDLAERLRLPQNKKRRTSA